MTIARFRSAAWASSLTLALAGAAPLWAQEIADTIYMGGPILTIDDARGTAEAVAVRDGRILAVGELAGMTAL